MQLSGGNFPNWELSEGQLSGGVIVSGQLSEGQLSGGGEIVQRGIVLFPSYTIFILDKLS